jgi:hypothetical protein
MTTGFTDSIIAVVKLYIEGVQVPYESIVINQGIGSLPTAVITIPPQAGLMDISKFYHPKVHIFYLDPLYRTSSTATKEKNEEERDISNVLFNGVILGVNYSKSITPNNGSVNIQFRCGHRNVLLRDLLLDYSNWFADVVAGAQDGTMKPDTANTQSSSFHALEGIQDRLDGEGEVTKTNFLEKSQTSVLPKNLIKFFSKLQGMPGCMVNYWNQLKRTAYNANSQSGGLMGDTFLKVYQPLVETGLQYFGRLSGHPVLEEKIQAGRINACPGNEKDKEVKIMVPPATSLMIQSAVQAELTTSLISSYLQDSGEITSIPDLFAGFYGAIDYEILTLSSPAEVPANYESNATFSSNFATAEAGSTIDETTPVETIVKPIIPFYYSPVCNVLLPGMFSSINIEYDDANVPTRLAVKQVDGAAANPAQWGGRVRAPHSIRTAIVEKVADKTTKNLASTTASSYGAVGKFEQGRGVKSRPLMFPQWLSYLSQSIASKNAPAKAEAKNQELDNLNKGYLADLAEGWKLRYPNSENLNPFSEGAGIQDHYRMLFSEADYLFTQSFASSKAGSIECPFNPYIVPGYPIDILEASPVLPSYHAMCSSVSHYITSHSIGTTIGVTGAMTYAELVNYYIPFMHPYLQVILKLAKNPTLVNNSDEAKDVANNFYLYTLGVGAAAPEDLYDFNKGTVKPLRRIGGELFPGSLESNITESGQEQNPNLSYSGNLRLVYRPIESQTLIQKRFGLTFIDLDGNIYNPTVVKYTEKFLEDPLESKLEIGQSQFLNYRDNIDVANTKKWGE